MATDNQDEHGALMNGHVYPPEAINQSLSPPPLIAGPPNANCISYVGMVGGAMLAAVLAGSQHGYLLYFHGRNANFQFLVKSGNNTFSIAFSFVLGVSACTALKQMKWNPKSTNNRTIEEIDNVQALPAIWPLFKVLRHRSGLAWPTIAAVFFQLLAFVSAWAPNALSVGPSQEAIQKIAVPTLDLSKGLITSVMNGGVNWWTEVSGEWKSQLETIMTQPLGTNWKLPIGCSERCIFEVDYSAPALECDIITPEQATLSSGSVLGAPGDVDVYKATTNLFQNPNSMQYNWDIPSRYNLSIEYAILDNRLLTRAMGGVQCHFRRASYKAEFDLSNTTKHISTSIVRYGDGPILGNQTDCKWPIGTPVPSCWINGINERALCQGFSNSFQGTISVNPSRFNIQQTNAAIIDRIFDKTPLFEGGAGFNLADPVNTLNATLVQFFANLTLGLMHYRNETVAVEGTVWTGLPVWKYTSWILGLVYGIAGACNLLLLVVGTRLVSQHGGKEDGFSVTITAVLNGDLFDIRQDNMNFDALQKTVVNYMRDGLFVRRMEVTSPTDNPRDLESGSTSQSDRDSGDER